MPAYNCFLSSVTTGWTVEGGGTALEAINKEVVEPTTPSSTKLLKTGTAQKIEVKLALPAELKTELEAGAKVVGLTVHANLAYSTLKAKQAKISWGAKAAIEPEIATGSTQTWESTSLGKAEAEEQTKTTLEATTQVVERIAGGPKCYAVYVTVEVESFSGKVQTAPKVTATAEVKTQVRFPGAKFAAAIASTAEVEVFATASPKTENIYYGPTAEKAAEETVKATKGTEHSCRFLDAWKAPSAGAPVIVVVHGGGWVGGGKQENKQIPEKIVSEAGFCAIVIDYRLASTSVGAFPKEVEDVEEAVRWAKEHATQFNGNPEKVFLLAGSAGAHLGAFAAQKLNTTEFLIKGIGAMSGLYDLEPFFIEMEKNEYFEPEAEVHAGGSANNLIENVQLAFQQTLHETVAFTHGQPVVAGKAQSNTAESRSAQNANSPTKQNVLPAPRWFMTYYAEDLIPANQQSGMKTHLENLHRSVKAHEQAGKGHGFQMFVNNASVRKEFFEFVNTPAFAPQVQSQATLKVAFVGGSSGTPHSAFDDSKVLGSSARIRTGRL